VEKYGKEKEEVRKEALSQKAEYDSLNNHDDQFDMAEACLSISIALAGVTALTQKRWLLAMATGLATVGVILGLAGFLGWSFHPDWLAKILT